ncbi:hypothetical protein ACQZ6V_07420 [Agrobacterium sp. 22-3674b3]
MKDNSRFYIPVLTFLVLASVVLLARYVSGLPDDIQSYVCKADDCTIQEWLSATAGWVGFVAAAIGAYFVFGQLAEQRRQTAFMLGDASPTIELNVAAHEGRRAQFEIVNWNRRRITIKAILFSAEDVELPSPKHIQMSFSEEEGEAINPYEQPQKLKYSALVGGWHDRQRSPHYARFRVCFEDEVEDYTDLLDECGDYKPINFKIEYSIDDEDYVLSYTVPAYIFLPRKFV